MSSDIWTKNYTYLENRKINAVAMANQAAGNQLVLIANSQMDQFWTELKFVSRKKLELGPYLTDLSWHLALFAAFRANKNKAVLSAYSAKEGSNFK